jgi:serine/threonine protein phosphatase PrpC
MSDRLVALANAAGGRDNTTVIVISLRKEPMGLWTRLWGSWFENRAVDA